MAEVAQRKLADVQKQHEAVQAKLEGKLYGAAPQDYAHGLFGVCSWSVLI
jgi:hypothetical protein